MKTTTDFAEWLSPMLVKELRQGLRSRHFVLIFLLLQAAMIFIALMALTTASSEGGRATFSTFYWLIVGVPLLVIMPISGLGAVANERKANNLELIFLTRLTPRRIMTGKWLAIVAQTVLLVCAVLPYAVLRYFLGGVNLGTELLAIGALVAGSAFFSGVAVGLSPQMSVVLRGVLGVGVFLCLQFLFPFLTYAVMGMSGGVLGGGPVATWRLYVGLPVLAVLFLFLTMEFGASKIAPPAANHSTSRRLIGLAALMFGMLFATSQARDSLLLSRAALLLLIPVCIGALSEPLNRVSSVYRPFVRRGLPGRIAGRFLYPGWPSGVWFTLAVLLMLAPVLYLQARDTVEIEWIVWTGVAIAGALLLPAAIIRTHMPKASHPAMAYFIIQGSCALLTLLTGVLAGFEQLDLRNVIAVIPTCGLLLTSTSGFRATEEEVLLLIIGTSLITFASACLLLLKMRAPWREIRALEKANASDARAAA